MLTTSMQSTRSTRTREIFIAAAQITAAMETRSE
jgi:hypothetical protein